MLLEEEIFDSVRPFPRLGGREFFLNLQSCTPCNREGSSVRDSQEGEGEGKVWYNGSA